MQVAAQPTCRIREFLNPMDVAEVCRLLEAMRSGMPPALLKNWQPPQNWSVSCPYADMSGNDQEYCTRSCRIHELLIGRDQ